MCYSIIYSSQTGNTKLLAETIYEALPKSSCIYFGEPSPDALSADFIFVGFWTDKGQCDAQTADFLKMLTTQQIFLFGTAGFGGSKEYFDQILQHTQNMLPCRVKVAGSYMCQGKMPVSVRMRYEKMKESSIPMPQINQLLQNFDLALSHPNEDDRFNLLKQIRKYQFA